MRITSYIEALDRQQLQMDGLLVLQQGRQIGAHRWTPDTHRNVYSVSKSFTSIAVGMAIGEGKLALTDRVLDAFGDRVPNPAPRLSALTLEHLLTMSRGYPQFTRPRTVAEVLAQPLRYDPGTVFVYDNASTFLASALLTKATGQTLRAFLVERLFSNLGIPDPVWAESEDGFTLGATGLELSTEELGVFGQFLLQRGNWQGTQLVAAQWIDGATRTQIPTLNPRFKDSLAPDYDLGYGYQFWICRHGAYRCDGKAGQFVVVLPRQEAVVAITAHEVRMKPILSLLWEHILPQL
ncbi:MAG: beta-lactamase family protein [Treponema sp.]|jgi:CubicO group peptidase (beta-lactamase class C family)|nr:beta-lactamase family protein [Treponema sp.]